MGVNALIYPELLAAQEIITALRRSWRAIGLSFMMENL